MRIPCFLSLTVAFLSATTFAERVSLFDGKSLDGWNVRVGEEKWWSVRDGVITGGIA